MKPRVCVCCGEAMSPRGNSLSRNPNVCPSCSSMLDGMEPETCSAIVQSTVASAEPVMGMGAELAAGALTEATQRG